MKVVIICGGKGERLREETEFKPKPLVEIGGIPILLHIMNIYAYYGHKEFILALGYKGYMIKEYFLHFAEMAFNFNLTIGKNNEKKIKYFGDPKLEGWSITFVDTGLETLSGGRVARIKDYLDDNNDFFYTYGDVLSDININKLYRFHKKMNKTVTITGINPPSPFGIIETKKNLALSFKEKPRYKGIINGGFWVCNKKIFNYITKEEQCQLEGEPLIKMIKDSEVAIYEYKGYWDCMDTYKQVNRLNSIWNSGNAPWKIWD